MKKKLVLVFICFISLFMLTGCKKKTAAGLNDFKKVCEDNGYIYSDVFDNYEQIDYINSAGLCMIDSVFLEFFVLSDKDYAIEVFNANKDITDQKKDSNFSEKSVSISNYSIYSYSDNSNYIYICRVDNTLIHVNSSYEYKQEINKLIEKMGY